MTLRQHGYRNSISGIRKTAEKRKPRSLDLQDFTDCHVPLWMYNDSTPNGISFAQYYTSAGRTKLKHRAEKVEPLSRLFWIF